MEQKSNIRHITAGYVFSWIVGILILLSSFSVFMFRSYVAGIIVVLCALLMIPYFDDMIAEKIHIKISGGLKVLLAIVAMIALSSGMGSGIKNIVNDTGGKVSDNTTTTTANTNISNGCPNIIKEPSKYTFEYGESSAGHNQLYLKASFILEMRFSDNYELDNKPNIGNPYIYESESFVCDKGTEQGESINELYCRPTYMYEPTLRRKDIDKDGNVIKTENKDIEYFVFDITGKDLNRANDLKGLKLKAMTCK